MHLSIWKCITKANGAHQFKEPTLHQFDISNARLNKGLIEEKKSAALIVHWKESANEKLIRLFVSIKVVGITNKHTHTK